MPNPELHKTKHEVASEMKRVLGDLEAVMADAQKVLNHISSIDVAEEVDPMQDVINDWTKWNMSKIIYTWWHDHSEDRYFYLAKDEATLIVCSIDGSTITDDRLVGMGFMSQISMGMIEFDLSKHPEKTVLVLANTYGLQLDETGEWLLDSSWSVATHNASDELSGLMNRFLNWSQRGR